jgi:hypothetical protein
MSTESPTVTVLKRLMQERDLTPHALSLAAGLRRDAVRSIIVGRSKRPGADILEALGKALGLPVDVLLGRIPVPAQALSPMAHVDEYDLSPAPDGKPEPADGRRPLATWRIPSAATGGKLSDLIMVSLAGVDDDGATQGNRFLVDVSARGKLLSPFGDRFLVWDGVGHAIAQLTRSGPAEAAVWKLAGRDGYSGMLPLGRVIARWATV